MRDFLGAMIAFGLMVVASGCATKQDRIDPKGSYPDLGTGNGTQPAVGELLVRPVAEPLPGGQGEHVYLPPSYAVYDDQGRLIQKDLVGEVTLPKGRYLVRMDRHSSAPSTFWVRVDAGKLTEVDFNRPMREPTPTGASE